jgi:hypothetical protein
MNFNGKIKLKIYDRNKKADKKKIVKHFPKLTMHNERVHYEFSMLGFRNQLFILASYTKEVKVLYYQFGIQSLNFLYLIKSNFIFPNQISI